MSKLILNGDVNKAGSWIPYAKKQLTKLKEFMTSHGLITKIQREPLPDGGEIVLSSFRAGVDIDFITINQPVGRLLPDLFVTDFLRGINGFSRTGKLMQILQYDPNIKAMVYGELRSLLPGVPNGISYFNDTLCITEWAWGGLWKFDKKGKEIWGEGLTEALPPPIQLFGGQAWNRIDVNQGRIAASLEYGNRPVFIFNLNGEYLYKIDPPITGMTSFAFVIANNKIYVAWYGFSQVLAVISEYDLTDGAHIADYPQAENARNIIGMAIYKDTLYLLESQVNYAWNYNDQKWEVTYRSYRIIEYSISTRQIGRITDLSLIIPFSDENSPSTGLITYFRFMDIAVDANDIWIVGHNTFNNSLLSTSSLDWVSNGLYRLNRGDMKYLGSILKKGFNKDQIIQPNFVTLRYRTVVNGGDKYADQ